MLSGHHPFAAPTPTAMIGQVLHQPPRPLAPTVPASAATIVTRALAKSPPDRYQTAHEIVFDLQHPDLNHPDLNHKDQIHSHSVASATTAATAAPAPRSRKRAIVFAVIVVAIVNVSVTYFVHHRHAHAHPAVSSSAAPVVAGTLAVLPPTVADAKDTKLATFGRGLAESLAQRLSDLSVNHDISVVSARQLEDKKVTTLADAAREVGATSALSLALTRDGDLVHAAYTVSQPDKSPSQSNVQSNAPAHVLASGNVTAPVTDMFSIENQLATATATALNVPLRTDEQRALASHGTTFPEAYQYFLQGRGYLLEAFTPETIKSAQIMFNEALRIDPNYGAAKAGLGVSWIDDYRLTHHPPSIEEARKACDQAVALGNSGAEGHMCLGTLARDTGEYPEAADQFQKALQLEPSNELASIGLAMAYEQLNQPDKAEATYKQIIALHPNYWHGYDLLGGFYFRIADYTRAEANFRLATEKDPRNFRSFSDLGAALLFLNRDQQAAEAFGKSIAIRPTAGATGNMGLALFRLRRFSEAAGEYRRAVQFQPEDYGIRGSLADAEYYGAEKIQAEKDYRKAIELAAAELRASPNDATILGDLASYHSMLGDTSQSIDLLNRSLTINHTDKELMFNAALVYNQLHQTGPALEWLGKALAAGYAPSVVAKAAALDNLHTNPRYQQLMQSSQTRP
jgi:tetratricopeptide (TPR) repeat protein